MSTSIPYKALEKPLQLTFSSEITERKEGDFKSSAKVSYVTIIPEKLSFWLGEQCIQVIREAAPVNSLSDNNADAFVQQASQALSHLTFKIGFKGMPVLLEKQDVLWKKWLLLREVLANTYIGDWVGERLTEIDLKMLLSDQLMNFVMRDLFLNDYFRNIYEIKFESGISRLQRTIYGLTPEATRLHEVWELKSSATHYNLEFSGKWKGTEISEQLEKWIKNKIDNQPLLKPEITSSGSFTISKETGWCSSFESNYVLITESGFEKVIKIKLTSI